MEDGDGDGRMLVVDQQTAREWFHRIADGVPQDKGLELLEKEATSVSAPDYYRKAWFSVSRKPERSKNGLTRAEILVLRMYTGTAEVFNARFNEDCRNRKWELYNTFTSLLHTAICKLRRKHKEKVVRLYRGLSCPSLDMSMESAFLPSFTSTSINQDVAEMYCGSLLTLESSTCGSIQDFSLIRDEAETLISPFQCFTRRKTAAEFLLLSEIEPTSPFLAWPLIRGSLLGVIVGNSIGSSYEFASSSAVEQLMENISALETPKGKHSRCYFSSDTCMTIALADSLTRVQGLDTVNLKKSLAEVYVSNPYRNYGASTAQVLRQLSEERDDGEDPFAPAKRAFNGEGSSGNGGAMRIAPAALYFWKCSDKQFHENIRLITLLTHTNPLALNGAILQASAVQLAFKSSLYGERKDNFADLFIGNLLRKMRSVENIDDNGQCSGPYCLKLEKIRSYLSKMPAKNKVILDLGNDLYAYTSVPTAIYCFLRGLSPIPGIPDDRSEFERTIIYAISLGGDTDTIASMAGAIAGAYYGQDAVTQRWRDLCETKAIDDAKRYADKIAKQCFWDCS